jgi:hypothetical protein
VILIQELEAILPKYEKIFGEFSKFVEIISPDISVEEIQSLPEQYHKLKAERELIMAEWVADHAHILRKENIDLTDIFSALRIIDGTNTKYKTLFLKLANIIPNS